MIKYICKKCNINTETSICPVCGERAEVENSAIYWCDDCNIPLYDEICPICGKKAHRIGSDLRPVFPEERLLLEVMLGVPFKYKNASVWNTSGNYYYADGKKIPFSVKQTKSMDAKKSENSWKFFRLKIHMILSMKIFINFLLRIAKGTITSQMKPWSISELWRRGLA